MPNQQQPLGQGRTANTVKGDADLHSGNSFLNAVDFLAEKKVRGMVNTAEVVRVAAAYPGGTDGATGYVDVVPLVCQTDAWNNTLPPATLYRLPYSRIQGGVAALVIDPVPGDIGVAVFTKRDSSNVQQEQAEPVQPGSFRIFDQADGFYIGGFLNKAPEIWLELTQDHVATLHAPEKVIVETKEAVVNASESCTVNTKKFTVNAPESLFNGNVAVRDNLSWGKEGTGWNGGRARITRGLDVNRGIDSTDGITNAGGLSNSGGINNTGGNTVSNGITLETHRHTGVETGGGSTGGPQ